MKIVKLLFLSVCGLFAIAAAAVAVLLFSPSIQTKIANSVYPDFSAESVSIGLSGADIKKTALKNVFSAESVELKYSLPALLSHCIKIDSAKISGAKISTAKVEKAATSAQPAEAAQPAKRGANAETGQPPKAQSSPKGGAGKFEFPWTIEVGSLAADADIDGKKFEASAKDIFVEKNLKPRSGFVKISTDDAVAEVSVETKNKLREIKALATAGDAKPLQAAISAPLGYSSFSAEMRIDADDSLAAKFVPQSVVLPKFSLALYAKAKTDAKLENAELEIAADSKISNLEKYAKPLEVLGEIGAQMRVSAEKRGGKISLKKLEANFSESGTSVLGLSAKPFEAATAEELEKAEIAGVVKIPPRLANAFANGLTLESDDIAGRFSVRKAGENFAISTTAPLSLTRATFKKGGEILASNLNLFANAAIVAGKTSSAKIELELADSKTSKLVLDIDAKYSGGAASGTLGLDGSLNPIVKNVPSMSAVSSLDLSAKADAAFEYAKTSAKLKSFALSISTADGKKAADISTLSAIEYDTASGNISATSPKLLLVDAPEFPFALVRPFAPEIDAAKAAARIEISSPKKNVYEMDSAFSVYALSYKKDGKYLIRGLSIDAAPKGSFDGATAKVEIPEGTIGEGSAKFCTFKASAAYNTKGKAAPSAKLSATTALAPIFNQPALLKFSNISRGTADISAVYENGKANADIAVHSLATRTANNVLETVKISAITDMESVEAKAEIKTTAGETRASASVKNSAVLDVKLDAPSIVVEDVLALAGAFSNPNYTEETAKTSAGGSGKKRPIAKPTLDVLSESKTSAADSIAKKDTKAFWYFGKDVSVAADTGRVVSNGTVLLEKFSARGNATASELSLTKFSGQFLGANFEGGTKITFETTRDIPYLLEKTGFKLAGLQAAKIFANKQQPPVEGVFDANLSVGGSGNNVQHLFQYATGSATVRSNGGGKIRVLDKNSAAGAGASVVGNALSIAGKLLNNRVKELGGIGELVSMLAEIDYSSAVVELSRNNKDYNYNIDLVEMKTDSLIFRSKSGAILFDPTVDFKEQKLDIPIVIYMSKTSRGLFQKMGYGNTPAEADGYYTGPEFRVKGTVSQPSNNLLEVLTSAKGAVGNAVGNALETLNIFKRK